MSAGTQPRRQHEAKAFFSWCRRMGHVDENPYHARPHRPAQPEARANWAMSAMFVNV